MRNLNIAEVKSVAGGDFWDDLANYGEAEAAAAGSYGAYAYASEYTRIIQNANLYGHSVTAAEAHAAAMSCAQAAVARAGLVAGSALAGWWLGSQIYDAYGTEILDAYEDARSYTTDAMEITASIFDRLSAVTAALFDVSNGGGGEPDPDGDPFLNHRM